jgi:hypothetical protein
MWNGERLTPQANMSRPVAISTFVPTLFLIARDSAEKAERDSRQTLVSILFSAAAIEGFLNDLLESLRVISGTRSSELPECIRSLIAVAEELEERNAQIQLKLQVFSAVLTSKPFDRSTVLYHDFDLLFRLRNSLVHYRPEVFTESTFLNPDHAQVLVRRLASRGLLQQDDLDAASLTGLVGLLHKASIAKWASDTATSTALEIVELFPAGSWREWARRDWISRGAPT